MRAAAQLCVAALVAATLVTSLSPGLALAAGPPPNDSLDNPTPIGATPYVDTVDMSGATGGDVYSYCNANPVPSQTIFYAITVAQPTRLTFSTAGSSFDTVIDVLLQDPFGPLVPYGCNDNDGGSSSSRVSATIDPGLPFLVMISNAGSVTAGTAVLRVDPPTPPANDDFGSALAVTTVPFDAAIDTFGGTRAADDPIPTTCGNQSGSGPTAWFALSVPSGRAVIIDTAGSDGDTRLSIWTGSRGALTEAACNDTTPQGSYLARLRFDAAAGETYYVLEDWGGGLYPDSGSLHLSVADAPPPPVNDDISGAIAVTPLPFDVAMNTESATASPSDPVSPCFGEAYGATVWFTYTAATAETVGFSGNANFGAFADVYAGSPDALSWQQCSRMDGGGFRLDPIAGTTYYIVVGSTYGGPGGEFSLHAEKTLQLGLTLNAVGRVKSRTGLATLTGTISCSKPAYVNTNAGRLTQKVGRNTIAAAFSIDSFFCPGGSVPWQTTAASPTGPFIGGQANVDLSIFGYAPASGEFENAAVQQSVLLKGTK